MLPQNWKQFAVIHGNERQKNKGFLSALKKAFNGGDVTPADPVVFTSGHSVVARSGLSALRPGILGSNSDGMTSAADSISLSAELPGERLQKVQHPRKRWLKARLSRRL